MSHNPYPGTFTDHVGESPDRFQESPNPPHRASSGEASTTTTNSGLSYHEPGGVQYNLGSPLIHGLGVTWQYVHRDPYLSPLPDASLDVRPESSVYPGFARCASPTSMYSEPGGPVPPMDPTTICPDFGGIPQHENVSIDLLYPPPTGVSLQHTPLMQNWDARDYAHMARAQDNEAGENVYETFPSSSFMAAMGHAPSILPDNLCTYLEQCLRYSNSLPVIQPGSSGWGDSAQRPVASIHSASASTHFNNFAQLPVPTPTSHSVSGTTTPLLVYSARNGPLRATSLEVRAGGPMMYGGLEGANTAGVTPSLPILEAEPVAPDPRSLTTGSVPPTSVFTLPVTPPLIPVNLPPPSASQLDWLIHPDTRQRYLILEQTRYIPSTNKEDYPPSNPPALEFSARASTNIAMYEPWYPLRKAEHKDLSGMPDRDAPATHGGSFRSTSHESVSLPVRMPNGYASMQIRAPILDALLTRPETGRATGSLSPVSEASAQRPLKRLRSLPQVRYTKGKKKRSLPLRVGDESTFVYYTPAYPLARAARGDLGEMHGRDALAFEDEMCPQKLSFRFAFAGFVPYTRQVNVLRVVHRQTVQPSKGWLAQLAGREMHRFLIECATYPTPFPHKLEDLFLESIEFASSGSLQPHVAVML